MKMFKEKRGWMRIVEAFVAILLIMAVLLIFVGRSNIKNDEISSRILKAENAILREIQVDETLRNAILAVKFDNPEVPVEVQQKINNRTPEYLNCTSKICPLNMSCELDTYLEQNVYAKPVAITANNSMYDPRQLKIFCWVK